MMFEIGLGDRINFQLWSAISDRDAVSGLLNKNHPS